MSGAYRQGGAHCAGRPPTPKSGAAEVGRYPTQGKRVDGTTRPEQEMPAIVEQLGRVVSVRGRPPVASRSSTPDAPYMPRGPPSGEQAGAAWRVNSRWEMNLRPDPSLRREAIKPDSSVAELDGPWVSTARHRAPATRYAPTRLSRRGSQITASSTGSWGRPPGTTLGSSLRCIERRLSTMRLRPSMAARMRTKRSATDWMGGSRVPSPKIVSKWSNLRCHASTPRVSLRVESSAAHHSPARLRPCRNVAL